MRESEQLSALIGEICDAALDPSLWPAALKGAAGYVGGPAAALYCKDAAHKSGHPYFDSGTLEPRFVALYFNKYAKLDPSTTGHFFAALGEPVATADIMPYDEFVRTRFYKEWARPQDLVDHVCAVLDKSGTSAALFGVFRHRRDGLADAETRRRMRLIVPHVRRAMLIGKILEQKMTDAANFAEVLDGINAGMVMVDSGGRIVHANVAGHAIFARGDLLRCVGGRLVARDAESDRSLHDVVGAACGGDAQLGGRGVALTLKGLNDELYVAHVLPLKSGARQRTGACYTAAAALFVQKAALATASVPEIVARTFRLTPTELRVLLAIVEVGGVPNAAEALGVEESTVRFHLHNLFDKTGTSRQADLVKILAGFSTPLLG